MVNGTAFPGDVVDGVDYSTLPEVKQSTIRTSFGIVTDGTRVTTGSPGRELEKARTSPPDTGSPVVRVVLQAIALPARLFGRHIVTEHREMSRHREAVQETVERPSQRRPDPFPGRERYYRRDVGPSRWIMVVVDFTRTPARIVTAFGLRRAHL